MELLLSRRVLVLTALTCSLSTVLSVDEARAQTSPPDYSLPPATGPNSTYQPGALTPPPVSRIDDYSYLSVPSGVNIRGIRKYLKALIDPAKKDTEPPGFIESPRFVFGYGLQLRSSDKRSDLGVPDLSISTREGLDFAFTPIVTGNRGFTASGRVDISGAFSGLQKDLDARNRFIEAIEVSEGEPRDANGDFIPRPKRLEYYKAKLRDSRVAGAAFNRMQTAPRVGLQIGYRDLPNSLHSISYGINYSRVYSLGLRPYENSPDQADEDGTPIEDRPYLLRRRAPRSGIQFSLAAFGTNVYSNVVPNNTFETSLRIAWLDQIPWIREGTVYRNTWQIGVEFTPDNTLAKSDSVGLFIRRRFEPGGGQLKLTGNVVADNSAYRRLISRSFEVTVGAGLGRDSNPYFLFRLGKSVSF